KHVTNKVRLSYNCRAEKDHRDEESFRFSGIQRYKEKTMGRTTSIKARRCEEWFFSDNLVVVVEVTADVHRGNTATLANAAINGSADGLATGSAFTSKNPKAATAATSRIKIVLLMIKSSCVFDIKQNTFLLFLTFARPYIHVTTYVINLP
ncbi:hypothetical protein V1478_008777, partial [Vespula squamosa]